MDTEKEYILGINQAELERLKFQHGVWKETTDNFLRRLNLQAGWKCLDVGSGPGFAAVDIAELVGDKGEVTLLEPAKYFLDYFSEFEMLKSNCSFRLMEGTVASETFENNYYDFIFLRWVVDFVPQQEDFMKKLFKALKPGGIIAVMDYYYEGLSLYPRGGAFDEMADIVRAYYKSGGGNAYFTGELPRIFREENIELFDIRSYNKSGTRNGDFTIWAHKFFVNHIPKMAESGLITREKADALLTDWLAHRNNPDMLFFAPNMMDIAGKKK